jgi:hypothetical protein
LSSARLRKRWLVAGANSESASRKHPAAAVKSEF